MGIELMVQTFLIAVFCILMTEVLAADYQVLQTRNYFYSMQEKIEYSRNDSEVILECVRQAEKMGYRLEWEKLDESGSCILLSFYYPIPLPEFLKNGGIVCAEEGVLQACSGI